MNIKAFCASAAIAIAFLGSFDLLGQSATAWNSVLVGSQYDVAGDFQASGTDLVGNATNPMLQSQRTGSSGSYTYYFRVRLGAAQAGGLSFYLGIDLDGGAVGSETAPVADMFVEAKIKSNWDGDFVSFHKKDGSKTCLSPSTTGWLNGTSNGEQQVAGAAVGAANVVNGSYTDNTDLDANGYVDKWLTFSFTESDLTSWALSKLSRSSVSGNTAVVIYGFTSTSQTANGDIAGINDKTASLTSTWSALGLAQTTTPNNFTTVNMVPR